jgi:hypothetical protein
VIVGQQIVLAFESLLSKRGYKYLGENYKEGIQISKRIIKREYKYLGENYK